jgi:DNA-binding SARP family transcriptional activator
VFKKRIRTRLNSISLVFSAVFSTMRAHWSPAYGHNNTLVMPMAHLKLSVLGAPRLEREGTPLELDTRKALALLVYLAMTGQSHSRDALASLFWPENDQSQGRTYLRRALWMLKNALGEEPLLIERQRAGLSSESSLWLDAAHFHHLLAACEQHGHASAAVCADCLAPLAEAAELYRDDFLAGFTLPDCPEFDEWQFFEGEGLRQALASVLKRLVQGHSDQGEPEVAIPYARRWLGLDSLHEPGSSGTHASLRPIRPTIRGPAPIRRMCPPAR